MELDLDLQLLVKMELDLLAKELDPQLSPLWLLDLLLVRITVRTMYKLEIFVARKTLAMQIT
jgi:hypothetical protein